MNGVAGREVAAAEDRIGIEREIEHREHAHRVKYDNSEPFHAASMPWVAAAGHAFRALQLDRHEVIDRDQDDNEHQPKAKAEADQLLLDGQQGLGQLRDFISEVGLRHDVCSRQLASGGLKPAKNSQEINRPTQITKPNRLTK